MTPARPELRAAFSLIETICVLSIIAVVFTMAASGIRGQDRAQRSRSGAETFIQALREAREAAVRYGWRIRVVLSLPRTELAALPGKGQPPQNAFAIFAFHPPVDAAQLSTFYAPSRMVEVGGGAPSTLSEWVAGGAAALPSGLVGQWRPLPEHPAWTRLPDGVQVDGDFLQEYQELGQEAFEQKHLYRPRAYWKAAAHREEDGWSNRSVFPPTYGKTPFPRSFPLITAPLPEDELVFDPSRGGLVGAREIWGTQPVPQFLTGADSGVRQFALPAIEFAPDGSLATTQRTPLRVRFHPAASADPMYEVAIDPSAGRATLQTP